MPQSGHLQVFAKILFSLQDTVKLLIKKHIVLNLNPTCFCFMKVEESVKRAQRNKKNCFDLTSRVSVQMHGAFILYIPSSASQPLSVGILKVISYAEECHHEIWCEQ